MKTLAVSNGDIQLSGGRLLFNTGTTKLIQDLTLWLQEPLGTGYTTPGFGSTLTSLIGGPQNGSTLNTVQTEILRVLQLYQGQQILNIKSAQNSAQLANWNKDEIIQSIQSVTVDLYYNSIVAQVTLQTLTGNLVNLGLTIGNNGVTVNNG